MFALFVIIRDLRVFLQPVGPVSVILSIFMSVLLASIAACLLIKSCIVYSSVLSSLYGSGSGIHANTLNLLHPDS